MADYTQDLIDSAYRAGLAGKAIPAQLAGDDDFESAYANGQADRATAAAKKDAATKAPPAAPTTPTKAAKSGPKGRARSAGKSPAKTRPGGRSKKPSAVARYGFGGSPGGLVLAALVYPVVLNTLLHGWKAGGRAWLAAKFLNNRPIGSGGVGIGIAGYGVGTNGSGGIKVTTPGGSVSAGGTLPAEPGWQNVPAPSFSTPGGK